MQVRELHPDHAPNFEERHRSFAALVASLLVFTATPYDEEVRQVASYFVEHVLLRIPTRDNVLAYVSEDGSPLAPEDAVFLALVRPSDQWLLASDDPAQEYAQPSQFATSYSAYYKSTRSVYLALDLHLAEPLRSLLLLHEAAHAYDHLVNRSRSTHRQEEHYAQSVEVRALKAMYGQPLKELLSRRPLLDSVRLYVTIERNLHWYEPSRDDLTETELDAIFGPARSAEDSRYRRVLVGRSLVLSTDESQQ